MTGSKEPCQSGQSTHGGITFNPHGGAAITVLIPPEVAGRLAPGLIERAQRVSWGTALEITESAELQRLTEEYSALLEHAVTIREKAQS